MHYQPIAPRQFPPLWPAEYRRLAAELGPHNPIWNMGTELPDEQLPDGEAFADPTADQALRPLPFLVRKHTDRVVVLAASRCFFHCRFCFRRCEPQPAVPLPETPAWGCILAWLRGHPEVHEVILSGGDPLTLSDTQLRTLARDLEGVPHLRRWRLHTRAPVVLPERVTSSLLSALESDLPRCLVLHANHGDELRPAVRNALCRVQRSGIPVRNQAVLLAGVNDSLPAQSRLWGDLSGLGVEPHYLHHPDRVAGNRRFRVSLRRGAALHRALARRLGPTVSGFRTGLPRYVVDLPNGAGKARVAALRGVAEERRGPVSRRRYRWVRGTQWDGLVDARRFEWWDIWEDTAVAKPGY